MSIETQVVVKYGYLHITAKGLWTTEEAIHTLEEAKSEAETRDIYRLLVDLRSLKMPESDFTRYETGDYLSQILRPPYKVAALANFEDITRFTEDVAVNRGANVKVFSKETDAREWLLKCEKGK